MEHKFGTWYPIEEIKGVGLETEFCSKDVLFYNHMGVSVGYVDIKGDFWFDNGAYEQGFIPTHFMPLPPPPEEKK